MSSCVIALLLSSAAFISYDVSTLKSEMVPELTALAQIIGDNSTPTIVFDDRDAGCEMLSALKVKKHITTASILVNGVPMASWYRDKITPVQPALQRPGHLFSKNRLGVLQDIILKGKKLGAVYIESDLEGINLRLKHYFAAIIIIILMVSVVIFFIASKLQRSISEPILQLARMTNNISQTEDYSIEIKKHSDDEIGQLFDEFNQMMRKIRIRDIQLTHARDELEQRVYIRTEELRMTLTKMEGAFEELKRTQRQLLQSEKLASIGQLAAGMAHEINNPLGFISNNMELVGQYIREYIKILKMVDELKKNVEEGNIEKAKAIIQDINQFEQEIQIDQSINDMDNLFKHTQGGLERIKKIVVDLRTFSHEDVDTMELVKVEEIIDSILSIVHNELKFKAELKKSYGETPLVKGSSQRLGQVFINLLVNAAQAIAQKGTIEVKTYQEGNYLCIDVKDTGKGIPPEDLKRIFDAFFTTKPVGQGTGLGLSLSYEIIKQHGGDIKVSSEVGVGTTFTIMLPLVKTT
jgi:signal transduction histidine kinase